MKSRYWTISGWFSPLAASNAAIACGLARGPRIACGEAAGRELLEHEDDQRDPEQHGDCLRQAAQEERRHRRQPVTEWVTLGSLTS